MKRNDLITTITKMVPECGLKLSIELFTNGGFIDNIELSKDEFTYSPSGHLDIIDGEYEQLSTQNLRIIHQEVLVQLEKQTE